MFHKDFYPTPPDLIRRMYEKIKNFSDVNTILDPSAGKGDLLKYLDDVCKHRRKTFYAIEIVPELQSILKNIGPTEEVRFGDRKTLVHVIDSDFLEYNGMEQFDLIFANFPFSDGPKHLAKAIEIMFSGQVVCLLNAESIRNPKTHFDRIFKGQLESMGAEIEFIKSAFVTAERKTNVEVALISLTIERTVEADLFKDMSLDEMIGEAFDSLNSNEVSAQNSIEFLVERYNKEREFVKETIVKFYENYNKVSPYLSLKTLGDDCFEGEASVGGDEETLTNTMKQALNIFSMNIKEKYWRDVLDLDEVKSRMTSEKRHEMMIIMERSFRVEFTEGNVKQFIINLMGEYPAMLRSMITIMFGKMTSFALVDDSYCSEEYQKHIHYFNAWKGNSAFCIKGKVIMPFGVELSYDKKDISMSYDSRYFLDDLDIVMAYFSELKPDTDTSKGGDKELMKGYFVSTANLVRNALERGNNKAIDTQFFMISIYKKGTIHLKFKDEDMLRRFNIEACKGKNFLPHDYSTKEYDDLSPTEKDFVDTFEGKKNYKQMGTAINCLQNMSNSSLVQIGFKEK